MYATIDDETHRRENPLAAISRKATDAAVDEHDRDERTDYNTTESVSEFVTRRKVQAATGGDRR